MGEKGFGAEAIWAEEYLKTKTQCQSCIISTDFHGKKPTQKQSNYYYLMAIELDSVCEIKEDNDDKYFRQTY